MFTWLQMHIYTYSYPFVSVWVLGTKIVLNCWIWALGHCATLATTNGIYSPSFLKKCALFCHSLFTTDLEKKNNKSLKPNPSDKDWVDFLAYQRPERKGLIRYESLIHKVFHIVYCHLREPIRKSFEDYSCGVGYFVLSMSHFGYTALWMLLMLWSVF